VSFLGGLFGGGGKGAGAVKRHAERAANKRAQAPDRWEALQALANMGTVEAVEALLPRFKFVVEPSITDGEEKDLAFQGVIAAGDAAVEPVVAYLQKAESISWYLKMLDQLLPDEQVIGHLLALLEKMDTEYERDPQRKIQMIGTLGERKDPRIVAGVVRFLDDANETVRFHSVSAIAAQDDPVAAKELLIDLLGKEDSVRVRVKICEALHQHGGSVGDRAAKLKDRVPSGWFLDAQGVPKRSTK
jgi:HEAT repeat protein